MKELLSDSTAKFDIKLYQSYIQNLYLKINERRNFEDLYGYLHRNIGFLGKSIELGLEDQSKFILPISWLFSLATLMNINILEALIKKFPGICPYCLESRCVCYKTNKKPLKPLPAYEVEQIMYYKWSEVNGGLKNFNLDKATSFITSIYPFNEVVWKSSKHHAHLLKIHQEMTEIHEAYANYLNEKKPINAVMDEIADVLAWILSAWAIMHPNSSLDQAFIDYYLHDCPVCSCAPCNCGLRDSRAATLPDFGKLSQIKENLNELSQYFSKFLDEFSGIINSYEGVIKTQNMPIAWATITQTKDMLEKLRKTATTYNVDEEGTEILRSTLNLVDSILRIEGVKISNEKSFDIFLSYSTVDKDQVRIIYDFLETQNINVFMAEKQIIPSYKWEKFIKDALKNSKVFCVIVSPNSLKSDWVKTELDSALFIDTPILPILYRCDLEQLPDKIKRYQILDYHKYEQIPEILEKIL